jgi:O-antigen/teichoic acid export membrane protein
MLNKKALGRGAVYLFIQVTISAISAYFFWLIMTQLTSSVVIGTLSTLISITEILTSFASFGIPNSIQRFLGKTFSEGNKENSKMYIIVSLFIITIGIITSTLFLLVGGTFFGLLEIDSNLQLILVFVVASKTVQLFLSSVVISTLKTAVLARVNMLSSCIKIVLSVFIVLEGAGAFGLAISYLLVDSILSSILLALVVINLLNTVSVKEVKSTISFTTASKEIVIAGMTNWVPILVSSIGFQLGTVVLFGYKGSSDAAIYFLTLNIVNGILFSSVAIFTIALPALSSMQDGRKRLAWQTIRWSSLISMPLSASLFFYSQDIMSLFGENYSKGELSLQILLLSVIPTIVGDGISNLVFSYGNYKQSLAIHLASNLPRIPLYIALIPTYGVIGGAFSFVIGSIFGLIVSVIIISKIKMFVSWKELLMISITPAVIAYTLHSLNIYFVSGILISIVASYLLLFKLHAITTSDIEDLLSILPNRVSNKILGIWKKTKN